MAEEEMAKRFCKFELCTHRNGEGMCCLFNQDNCIFHRLEKENEQLRNNGFTVSAMTEQQLKVAIEKGEQLEKENAELKEKAKEIIKNSIVLLTKTRTALDTKTYLMKAEQFLKEINYEII